MSLGMQKRKNGRNVRTSWKSVAFLVESMLLLVFLVASLAVLAQVFTASLNRSVESRTLDAASIAAGSIAEHFAADPSDVQEVVKLGDLLIRCETTEEPRSGGTMYKATIDVYDSTNGNLVYSLPTSRYVSEVAR